MQTPDINVEEDPLYQEFINKRKLNKSTIRVYAGRLNSFCKFSGLNPSELISQAKNEDIKEINERFHEYIEYLKHEGKSSNTIYNKMDTVKAFYNQYHVDVNHIDEIVPTKDYEQVSNKIITKDQIQEALKYSSLRDKAIILLHMSSGMETTELRKLTYGDFIDSVKEYIDLKPQDYLNIKKLSEELLKEDEPIGTWKIKKNRINKIYVTFNSPESIESILNYLKDRERKNKPVKSLKDPLFVNSQNKVMNVSVHSSIFKRVNERAKFGHITDKRRFFSSTMLRKYFRNKLNESGLDEVTINTFLGQKVNVANVEFSIDQVADLKSKYISAIENLSLENPKTVSLTTKEYNKLLEKIESKDKELNEIKKHLKHLKHVLEL